MRCALLARLSWSASSMTDLAQLRLRTAESWSEEDSASREGPHPIDRHVGLRIRMRRKELGVSQEKLAEALGLTFQQIQKYERAANRISASRLYRMGMTLGVDVPFFFEG